MKQIRFNNHSHIINFFKDKRVVFVGPSPILENSSQGEFIDSFDIVCRVNHSICLDEQKKDYGSRCDFLFHSLTSAIGLEDETIKKWKERLLIEKPKMIGFVRSAKRKYKGILYLYAYNYYRDFIRDDPDLKDIFTFHFSNGLQNTTIDVLTANPLSGTLSLIVLLSMPIKSLHIMGFDYYQHEKIYHTFLNHESLTGQPEFNPDYQHGIDDDKIKEFSFHNQTHHIAFAKYLYNKHKGIVTVDDFLQSLFDKLPEDFDYSKFEFENEVTIC